MADQTNDRQRQQHSKRKAEAAYFPYGNAQKSRPSMKEIDRQVAWKFTRRKELHGFQDGSLAERPWLVQDIVIDLPVVVPPLFTKILDTVSFGQ
jgi:hypothetical protein